MNTTAAFPVQDASQIAEPRRAAAWLATRIGFNESDAGRVALVLTEMATNLVKHANHGEVLLHEVHTGNGDRAAGIEIIALDGGPGIRDVPSSRRDGYSTVGTLGHGLGTIERQADVFQLYTHTTGSVALARIWRDGAPDANRQPLYEIGAVYVSKPGEDVCGDAFDWRSRADRLAILVADGLGHGLPAHDAARAATQVFAEQHEQAPERILGDVHAALRPTRGAAAACLAVDVERGTARYCGVGNISAVVLLPNGGRHSMVSQNGTAGHTVPRLQEFNYPVPRQSIIVLYSDGLSSHWDLAGYPGLRTRHPSIIAAVLYRDFSRRRDDVTVVVAKEREGLSGAEKQ